MKGIENAIYVLVMVISMHGCMGMATATINKKVVCEVRQ